MVGGLGLPAKSLVVIVSSVVAIAALLLSPDIAGHSERVLSNISAFVRGKLSASPAAMPAKSKMPVYFFSHGGPNVQYDTQHPVYPVLQSIGREITEKVKPKAVVVFSAHWQGGPDSIHVNTAEKTDLIYDFGGFPKHYYEATYPNVGSPSLAARVRSLLADAGIKSEAVTRGLDHGVWSGFSVAFDPAKNPLGVPLVQVSLFRSEDPEAHLRLGAAVAPLRDEGVLIIGAGMSVHNLRDIAWAVDGSGPETGAPPLPYAVSFDEAARHAVEQPGPDERRRLLVDLVARGDARQAHPHMDHLMPLHVAAGAAGEDRGRRTWTFHEGSFAWAQFRFGEVPGRSG